MRRIQTFMPIQTAVAIFLGFTLNAHAATFDAYAKLEEGRRYNNVIKQMSRENAAVLKRVTSLAAEIGARLEPFGKSNEKLAEVIQNCTTAIGQQVGRDISESQEWKVKYLAESSQRGFDILSGLVSRYNAASSCSGCDSGVRAKALKELETEIIKLVDDMKPKEADRLKPAEASYRESFLQRRYCLTDTLFEFHDTEKFKTVLYGQLFSTYDTGLSPATILSGQYQETLEYIAERAPIRVYRSAALFGTPNSYFDGNEVYLWGTYDGGFIGGADNREHPKVGNPVLIIHRDR